MAPAPVRRAVLPLIPFHWTLVQNIKRDPFEQAVAASQKVGVGLGGALAAPVPRINYDWNMLPIGQLLWVKELMSYKSSRRCKRRRAYNLDSDSGTD